MIRAASLALALLGAWPAGARDGGLQDLAATRDRPLFSPTRRAPPPPKSGTETDVVALPVQTPPPAAPNFRLDGIIIGTRGGIALLTRGTDAKTVRVTLGADLDGWTVSLITPRAITLRRNGQERVIAMLGR